MYFRCFKEVIMKNSPRKAPKAGTFFLAYNEFAANNTQLEKLLNSFDKYMQNNFRELGADYIIEQLDPDTPTFDLLVTLAVDKENRAKNMPKTISNQSECIGQLKTATQNIEGRLQEMAKLEAQAVREESMGGISKDPDFGMTTPPTSPNKARVCPKTV
jgi:hypothetical protein